MVQRKTKAAIAQPTVSFGIIEAKEVIRKAKEDANTQIAPKIQQIQQLWQEIVDIAREAEIDVEFDLGDSTNRYAGDPNSYWNSSSAHC